MIANCVSRERLQRASADASGRTEPARTPDADLATPAVAVVFEMLQKAAIEKMADDPAASGP